MTLIALTRAVPASFAGCELTHLDREPIDVRLAESQHAAYEAALRAAGCRVERLDATPDLPDSVFVEDTAVVLDELAGVNVLVIDDDDGIRAMIGTMLTTFGARVTYAASAVEAMELTESMEPDVLVSDIAMPGEDGYEFIRRLRSASSRQAAIPAVAVTAYAEPRDRDRAIAAGFDAHVGKPVEPRTLADAVLQILRIKR